MKIDNNIQYINVEDIIPNRFQPRLTFDENALKELATSIKEHGIIQPLVLRKLSNNKYEIIAGERRYKASQLAGLNKVPAIIADLDDNTSAEVALVENLQRRNLSAIEEAKSYRNLLDRGYLTQDELAKRLGISQSSVANKVRLLNLTDEVQKALMNEKISERHARSLLQLSDPLEQINMLNQIIERRLTVRQLDNEINKIKNKINPKTEQKSSNINVLNTKENNDLYNQIETLDFKENEIKSNDKDISSLVSDFTKSIENQYNYFDIATAEEVEELDLSLNNKTDVQKDLNQAINHIKEEVETIKKDGFFIETEEYDFEDLYQIIIKIEK